VRGKGPGGKKPHERYRHEKRLEGSGRRKPSGGCETLETEGVGCGKPEGTGLPVLNALKGNRPQESPAPACPAECGSGHTLKERASLWADERWIFAFRPSGSESGIPQGRVNGVEGSPNQWSDTAPSGIRRKAAQLHERSSRAWRQVRGIWDRIRTLEGTPPEGFILAL